MDSMILASIALGASGLSNALQIWNFFQSPSKKNEGEIASLRAALDRLRSEVAAEYKNLDDKVDVVTGRVSTIETIIQHMPDTATVQRLELNLERVLGRIETLSVQLGSVEHLSRRLQNMMTSGGGE